MHFEPALPIGEAESFYGYIVGLFIAPRDGDEENPTAYAVFEYNGEESVYRVPDPEIFDILSKYLASNAYEAITSDTYSSKLYIKKENGQWSAELP